MLAKFAGSCEVCAGAIQPGDSIESAGAGGSRRWVHQTCAGTGALIDIVAVTAGADDSGGSLSSQVPPSAAKAKRKRPVRPAMPVPDGAVEVYTDGACSGTPGIGGWAWAIDHDRYASGSDPVTTNQRMEIQAALEAVKALPGPLVVVSDSTYVVNCFRDAWWRNWRTRGWVSSAKTPVANRDLWEPLVDLVEERGDVVFHWVKGHSGDPMNDLVDRLAVEAKINQS